MDEKEISAIKAAIGRKPRLGDYENVIFFASETPWLVTENLFENVPDRRFLGHVVEFLLKNILETKDFATFHNLDIPETPDHSYADKIYSVLDPLCEKSFAELSPDRSAARLTPSGLAHIIQETFRLMPPQRKKVVKPSEYPFERTVDPGDDPKPM